MNVNTDDMQILHKYYKILSWLALAELYFFGDEKSPFPSHTGRPARLRPTVEKLDRNVRGLDM